MVATPPAKTIKFPSSDLLSDEPPLETERHLKQILLLLACLEWWWRDRPDSPQRDDFYAAGNMSIYYSPQQKRSEDFRGPDFFVVLGTQYKERKSWVVWEEEGKYPNIIIEMLSETTANVDKGKKKDVYQNVFQTPEYFWFDPYSLEFQGFLLQNGKYGAIVPNPQGWLWSQQLELYLGIVGRKLRFLTAAGELVPTPDEAAISQNQRAEQAEQRAEQAEQRAEQAEQCTEQAEQRAEQAKEELAMLRQKLQERGINLDE